MKTLVVIGACLLASAAWAQSKIQSVFVTNPSLSVQAVDAGRYTHVGQKPSRIVNLLIDRRTETAGYRVDPATGAIDTASGIPFRVPAGFLFVLTDITGSTSCNVGTTPSYAIIQFNAPTAIFRAALDTICPDTGTIHLERHYETGMVFGAGAQIILMGMDDLRGFADLQGYLVPAD